MLDNGSTLADQWCRTDGGTPEGLRAWWSVSQGEFNHRFTNLLSNVYKLSQRQERAVIELVNDDTYLSFFVELYSEIQTGGKRAQDYLHDSFQYSISQALKQLAQEVAGVEALNYVSAWTELHTDFGDGAAGNIWLSEIGMGGIGVMRATHDLLRKAPERFWTTLAHKMTRCPTAQEEALLRYVLAQPTEWLTTCEHLVDAVTSVRSSSDRRQAIETLLGEARRHLGILIRQEHIKSLLRVFIPDYTQRLDEQPLSNWRLFREINHEFLPRCVQNLGREPSFTEARAMLYTLVRDADQSEQPAVYPELTRLLHLYQAEYGPEPDRNNLECVAIVLKCLMIKYTRRDRKMAPLMTVEQILAAAQHLSVTERLQLIAGLAGALEQAMAATPPVVCETTATPATSLLDVAGTWVGDDFDACLQMVYATRQPITQCTCNNPA